MSVRCGEWEVKDLTPVTDSGPWEAGKAIHTDGKATGICGEVVSSVLDRVTWGIQRHWLRFWSPEERASQEMVHNMSYYSLTTL